MSKGHVCGVCGKDKSAFIMNNKKVCFHCDELLFDMEIECEEIAAPAAQGTQKSTSVPTRTTDKKTIR